MDESKIIARLELIEQRLNQNEKKLDAWKEFFMNSKISTTAPESIPNVRSTESSNSVISENITKIEKLKNTTTQDEVIASKPGNFLGIIAVICFVFAAVFIVKLSIDTGWLTPIRQLGLAAALGISLIIAGIQFLDSDIEYASLLPGCGIIILYLTVYSAHTIYSLASYELALTSIAIISCFCIYLYKEINNEIYPLTSVIGTYLVPILLNTNETSDFTVFYFVLSSIGFSIISIWLKSRMVTIVSAYLAILMTAMACSKRACPRFS